MNPAAAIYSYGFVHWGCWIQETRTGYGPFETEQQALDVYLHLTEGRLL